MTDITKTQFDENLIKVTKYDVLGKLPDPFLGEDGKRISDPFDWYIQRELLYKTAVEIQYGTIPPEPEFFKVERTYETRNGGGSFTITAGTNEKQVQFYMKVMCPQKGEAPFAAVVDGDLCFEYAFNNAFHQTFTQNEIMLVMFDRTQLAPDITGEGAREGFLYDVYPEYTFGSIGAWAWGYARCVDALELLELADMDNIAFTGHSRGGKTAILAGVIDERASIVNPNETCAGGCGCFRIHMRGIREDGNEYPSETLANITETFPTWFGPELRKYAECEADMPFDSHFLKALIAPRTLFVSEAASDMWANPVGTWMTTMAAGEVYKFLGVPENLLWYYRKGYHCHDLNDIEMLVAIIRNRKFGDPLPDCFFKTPFVKPELIFDWKAP